LPIYSNMVESRKKMWSLCMRSRCFKVSPTYMERVSSIVMSSPIVRPSLNVNVKRGADSQISYLAPTRRSNLSISELPKSLRKATRLSPVPKSSIAPKLQGPMLLESSVILRVHLCTWLRKLSRMRNLVDLEVQISGRLGVVYSRL
jgi:hypothetical protein